MEEEKLMFEEQNPHFEDLTASQTMMKDLFSYFSIDKDFKVEKKKLTLKNKDYAKK